VKQTRLSSKPNQKEKEKRKKTCFDYRHFFSNASAVQ
jgi:hypothetical protein